MQHWKRKNKHHKVGRKFCPKILYKKELLNLKQHKTQEKLTFFQKLSFPIFLSFLSKQQAPIIAECRCERGFCLVESLCLITAWRNWVWPLWHMQGNYSFSVSGLRGLTGLYLTPCECGAMTGRVCVWLRELCLMHTPSWREDPPLAFLLL